MKLLEFVIDVFCKLGLRRVDLGVGTGFRLAGRGDTGGFVCSPELGSVSDDDIDMVNQKLCFALMWQLYGDVFNK